MRILLAALIVVAGAGHAQQSGEADRMPAPGNGEKASPAAVARRLESVTWEPLQGQLTWTVSVWDLHSDMTHPADMERYVIHVGAGTIESKGETKKFEVPEDDLHALMDILSVYAMRSTIWWEHSGEADRAAPPEVLPDNKDKPKSNAPDEKPKAAPGGKALVLQKWIR
jgi:hypothetical protein